MAEEQNEYGLPLNKGENVEQQDCFLDIIEQNPIKSLFKLH
jgi:hypothetical protein